MANCLYSEIRDDLKWVADELDDNDIQYKVYNGGVQFNAEDANGVIHSYYPTTGTILYHASNDRKDRRMAKETDKTLFYFIEQLKKENLTKHLFKEA